MRRLIFVTHPEVIVDPACPIEKWSLDQTGIARTQRFARSDMLHGVSHLWSSVEQKAKDTALILSAALKVPVQTDPQLGENDRSATGFLPHDQFEVAADQFFARPDHSYRGWETAQAAQTRIVDAVMRIVEGARSGDIAVVSHGAVGTLLYCHLTGNRIDRSFDQPHQGHFWVAPLPDLIPQHGWRSIG